MMTDIPSDGPRALRDNFRAAMRRFTATVSVISCCLDGRRHGMTATAVTSVSLDPPSLLVCVNRNGRLFGMLERSPRFCVNVLHAAQSAVSQTFAQPHSAERFAQGEWEDDAFGIRERHYIGIDSLCWGNDYPHTESTFPRSQQIMGARLRDVPAAERDKILHGNVSRIYGFGLE